MDEKWNYFNQRYSLMKGFILKLTKNSKEISNFKGDHFWSDDFSILEHQTIEWCNIFDVIFVTSFSATKTLTRKKNSIVFVVQSSLLFVQ